MKDKRARNLYHPPGEILMGEPVELAEKGPKYHITVPGSAYAVIKV
ncbi:MAG: hypothetical protein K9M57_07370 [Phycisphaerae bacterium]|nr:hypothetical protein [Phycisphaerae bacterium]